MTAPQLSAAVLTGGQSRRMGTDKALLEVGGMTLLERTLDVVRQVSDDVFVVGDRRPYHRFGVPVVADAYPGTGPLGGIATALRHARNDLVLVVACDLPFLSGSLLRAMADYPRDYDALVPLVRAVGESGERPVFQPLHAIYTRRCLAVIEAYLAKGGRKVSGFFDAIDVRTLDEAWVREIDPELDSFVNANNPGELQRARERL